MVSEDKTRSILYCYGHLLFFDSLWEHLTTIAVQSIHEKLLAKRKALGQTAFLIHQQCQHHHHRENNHLRRIVKQKGVCGKNFQKILERKKSTIETLWFNGQMIGATQQRQRLTTIPPHPLSNSTTTPQIQTTREWP